MPSPRAQPPLELLKALRGVRRGPDQLSYLARDLSPLMAMQLREMAPEHGLLFRGKLGEASQFKHPGWVPHPIYTSQDPFHALEYSRRGTLRDSDLPRLQIYALDPERLAQLPVLEGDEAWNRLIRPLRDGEDYSAEALDFPYTQPAWRLKNIIDSRLDDSMRNSRVHAEDQFLITDPSILTRYARGGPVHAA
jgi:hypothetical protein